uniref:Uncharacterized protein n=1 Tax=Leersia perrieri TaxID=77586 RepID=A0A0D9V0N2_9ORYZ
MLEASIWFPSFVCLCPHSLQGKDKLKLEGNHPNQKASEDQQIAHGYHLHANEHSLTANPEPHKCKNMINCIVISSNMQI